MTKIRALLSSVHAMALLIVDRLTRVAKRMASPGAGPKLMCG